jgi:NAD(P)-dependent dehydrogenase (short-subunit alcohol dehydrogenase family)
MSEDNVVIVTGAGGGLGRAMVRGLLLAGRRVVGVDIESAGDSLEALRTDADKIGCAARLLATTGNIRSPESTTAVVEQTLEHFGTVHAVVNNAGLGPYGRPGEAVDPSQTFLNVPIAYWTALIDTNVNGTFLMTRAVAPHFVRAGWGKIINISTSISTMTLRGMAPYGASKAAIESFTAIWAKDLQGTGITANVLAPGGPADTAFVPVDAVPDRSKLISPDVMVAPVIWLTSHASDDVSSMRIIGKDWRVDASAEDNLHASAAPIAFGG